MSYIYEILISRMEDGHIDLYIDEDEILDYLYTIWE